MIDDTSNLQSSETTYSYNLVEYFHFFVRWIWLILLIAALSGGAAYIYSIYTTPIYETAARLLVSDPPAMRAIDYSAITTNQTIVQTYAKMLTDTPVLNKVIEKLNLDTDYKTLSNAITTQAIAGTQLISIRVEDPSPTLAVQIADTIGQVFAERISELQAKRYATSRGSLEKQVSDMERQINDTSEQLLRVNDLDEKLQLESRLTEYRKLYANLVTNYEQVRLAEAQNSANVVQVQPAQLPTDPVRPKTVLYVILASILGMLLAGSGLFIFHSLDDKIRNPDQVRQLFNLPVLGMISRYTVPQGKTMMQDQPRSPVSESYRALRTNITYASVDNPLKRIMVTSATPQNGKTTITANLGVAMANNGLKVTLIDADMRRPYLYKRFGLSNRQGLSSLFIKPLNEIHPTPQTTDVPSLTVLTAGSPPPNPSELLVSRKMLHILDLIGQNSDLILIDTPPLLNVTDAAALAPMIDGVILVVKPGTTPIKVFGQALEQLKSVRAHILGVVFNNMETKDYPYGYYADSSYGSSEEPAPKKSFKDMVFETLRIKY